MGKATWEPKWWTAEKHGSTWDKVKEAMKRDWEQTKADLDLGGRELNQSVGDTVRQAAGKEPIPAETVPNSVGTVHGTDLAWSDAEEPIRYGYGARSEYGTEHADWSDKLEARLRTDWESAGDKVHRGWDDVRAAVRRGYERARH